MCKVDIISTLALICCALKKKSSNLPARSQSIFVFYLFGEEGEIIENFTAVRLIVFSACGAGSLICLAFDLLPSHRNQ